MNNNNKKFYVYIHFKKDSLEPFYVGKGKGNRYQSSCGRNRYWCNIVNKYGFVPDILKHFENEQDAFDYEKEMIKFFREEGYKLCNMTDGGEGVSGLKRGSHSLEHRAKLSAAHKGKTISPEARAKLSATRKGKTISPEARSKMSAVRKGRVASPEARAKMSAAKIKTIIATNLSTGETFEIRGGKQEMKALGFYQGAVSACARGVSKSHKGHTFKFKSVSQDAEL